MNKNNDIKKIINNCMFYCVTNFRGGTIPNVSMSDEDKIIFLYKQYKKMLQYYNDLIKVTNKKTRKYKDYLSKIDIIKKHISMLVSIADDYIFRYY